MEALIRWGFVVAVAAAAALRIWLVRRQQRHVTAHRVRVPDAFRARVTDVEHRKAARYTVAKGRLALYAIAYDSLLALMWTVLGGLEWIDRLVRDWSWSPAATGTAFLVIAMLLSAAADLPLAFFRTFSLEERFGFNKTTRRTFWLDALRGALLILLLAAPLAFLALFLMGKAGSWWWLAAWGTWLGFALLLGWIVPAWIAPLFSKFTPLPEGALRTRLEALVTRLGFRAKGLFVMDGSRRSAHSNAYFTGLGRAKRIVLYDTLVESMEPEELEAVLAHELGHAKLRHILRGMAWGVAWSLAGLALLGLASRAPEFFHGLGMGKPSLYGALALFLVLNSVLGIVLSPVWSRTTRRYEYEADAFAARKTSAAAMTSALVKLYRDNASTLTPDPLYALFHYSHPPPALRVARLAGT